MNYAHTRKPVITVIPFHHLIIGLTLLAAILLGACASAPSDKIAIADSQTALIRFVERDPGLQAWIDNAEGYAVYPSVGKGGLGIGGAYGNGIVFQRRQPVGRTSIIQGSIGAQIGAQNFAQVVFFRDDVAFRNFQRGNYEFSAQVTAVAVNAGAAATTSYDGGVAVFILTKGGLMAEASVGGQKLTYQPL